MQVLAVAVLGGLATLATSKIQQIRMDNEKEKDERRVQVDKEKDERIERWRRESDALRKLAEETIAAYNKVKGIRRLLRADIGSAPDSQLNYELHMGELNDLQLEFEGMKRLVPFMTTPREPIPITAAATATDTDTDSDSRLTSVKDLANEYAAVEKFLNRAVADYEKRQKVPTDVSERVTGQLTGVSALLDKDGFRTQISSQINVIIEVLFASQLTTPPDSGGGSGETS